MELFNTATMIRRELSESRANLEDVSIFRQNPVLLERVVSKLSYCVRDEAVRYLAVDFGSSAEGEEAESFRMAAYTDDYLFHLAYDIEVDRIVTTILARTSISRIEVLAAPIITTIGGGADGVVNIAAYYGNLMVRMPADNRPTQRNRETLDSWLLALEKDLLGHGASS